MATFRELVCIHLYGGHVLRREDIIQLGTSNLLEPFNYEYGVTCSRCGKMSIVERKVLDDILRKDDPSGTT